MGFNHLVNNQISLNAINFIHHYIPKHDYADDFSSKIIEFKKISNYSHKLTSREIAILKEFKQLLSIQFLAKLPLPIRDYLLCSVPSHKESEDNKNSFYYLSKWTDIIRDNYDKDLIWRSKTIQKLSFGGNRSIQIHLDSLKVSSKVRNKRIIVLDDVTTTGNSLIATRELLLLAGAKEVILFAFTLTKKSENEQ